MRNDRTPNGSLYLLRRAMAGLLCLVMLMGMLPELASTAQASSAQSWAIPYMQQLVDWNIMRGNADGSLSPERDITRAEFVALMNRAYGYTQVGETPFTDITGREWYADDIAIGYTIGYFKGTSENTASPNAQLTREQAAVLLARNMMLRESVGEVMDFTDGRDFSDWSRGLMKSLMATGVITGGSDGSFLPQNNISRGEVAAMLVRAIGTPINEPGDYNLGSVYGNVTISSSDVSLRNTTIAGDLYLTGGVDLGSVLLENVTVLGRIVASGGGESNAGESSIVLRNVQGSEMVVDSIGDQFVTIRSEGDTDIGSLEVRTSAYIEDVAPDGFGFLNITLDGERGMNVQLAGNIKEVTNLTPASRLVMAQGTAERITVDEKAVGSALVIDGSAKVGELNLDVGTGVTGDGDIDHLNVNAAGSNVTMLPDTITVRPGITAGVGGETMDSAAAAESSEDPRLLAGYPSVKQVAPTSATAVFSTNKRGTIYWAVSALADGSVGAADLLEPPTYGGIVLKSGTINATASNTEYTASLTELTSDGSYYLSAILVDNRGEQSPLKVTAFTTPDDATPAFASGYPVMSKITMSSAQVTVMTNKSCQVFWAVLPKGSTAPRAQDFKAGSITGNLGYGSLDAVKNSTLPFTVNSIALEEKQEYDLYLWLNDYNGAKSSEVTKLTFTTIDGTPPIVRDLDYKDSGATTVDIYYVLNEPGTLYWAVVLEGDDFFRPLTGQTTTPEPTDTAAKIQVENGVGAVQKGNSKSPTAEATVDFTISGLAAETSYDLYYVAKDEAGNYSDAVQKITIKTADDNAPTVKQEFTSFNDGDTVDTLAPLADTSVRLVFSESVQGYERETGDVVLQPFLALYNEVLAAPAGTAKDAARNRLAEELRKHIELYRVPTQGQPVPVEDRARVEDGELWVIDYRYAIVEMESGKMVITFPNSTTNSAINLQSGTEYYFRITGVADTAVKPNLMGNTTLPRFKTAAAQVFLDDGTTTRINVNDLTLSQDSNADENGDIEFHATFTMTPKTTDKADGTMHWDMLIWADYTIEYTLYAKPEGEYYWRNLGSASITTSSRRFVYRSLTRQFLTAPGDQREYGLLNELEADKTTEYAIHISKLGGNENQETWNEQVNFRVTVAAGSSQNLDNMTVNSYEGNWEESLTQQGGLTAINTPQPYYETFKKFSIGVAPDFENNFPTFNAGDTQVTVQVMLTDPGTVHYLAVPLENLNFGDNKNDDGESYTEADFMEDYRNAETEKDRKDALGMIEDFMVNMIPTAVDKVTDGVTDDRKPLPEIVPAAGTTKDNLLLLERPTIETLLKQEEVGDTGDIRVGTKELGNAGDSFTISNLKANTVYYIYMFTEAAGSDVYSDNACCFYFVTGTARVPIFTTMRRNNPGVTVTVDISSNVTYYVMPSDSDALGLSTKFSDVAVDDTWKTDSSIPSSYKDKIANDEFTVLDALTVTANNKRTIYDNYADVNEKRQLAIRIGDESNNANVDGGGEGGLLFTEGSVDEPLTQYIDCSKWMTSGYYVFIATAYSQALLEPGSGADYAFRAVSPIQPTNSGIIEVVSTDPGCKDPESDPALAYSRGYNGRVIITFNDTLCLSLQKDGLQIKVPILQSASTDLYKAETDKDGNPVKADSPIEAEYVPLGYLVRTGTSSILGEFTIEESVVKERTETITLTYENLFNGASINFSGVLCGTDKGRNGSLRIVMRVEQNEVGLYAPAFYAEWNTAA